MPEAMQRLTHPVGESAKSARNQVLKPLRICLVCHEYPPAVGGGIGTYTRNLGRALVSAGHEVRVIGVYSDASEKVSCAEEEGVKVWRLRRHRGPAGWIADRYRLYRTVAQWSKCDEIDLIEVPDWQGWAAGWPSLRVPVVARLHGSAVYFAAEFGKRPARNVTALERASLRRADYWCSVSQYAAEKTHTVFNLPPHDTAVIYPFVELRPVTCLSDRSRNSVVYTGTLTAKKGIVSLIQAWPLVLARRPDAQLSILGRDSPMDDGRSMMAFLRQQLDETQSQNVEFRGFLCPEELHQTLATARIAVFPSFAESFGFAPVEAMVHGCPTIFGSRTSGPEIINDGVDGLLVNVECANDIAEAIVKLLDDDALAERLSVAGRTRCEQLSSSKLLPEYEAFYRSCIGNAAYTPTAPICAPSTA
jgi:glycosyltransferase involved in cell wall biosynthesis